MKIKFILKFITAVLDYVAVVVAFAVSYLFRDYLNGVYLVTFDQFLVFAFVAAIIYVLLFLYLGHYSVDKKRDLVDQFFSISLGSLAATTLAGSVIYFARSFDYSRLIVGIALILSTVFVWLVRVIIRLVEKTLYRKGIGNTKVLLIGFGQSLETTIRGYQTEETYGYQLAGIILTKVKPDVNDIEGVKILFGFEEIANIEREDQSEDFIKKLEDFIHKNNIQEIVLAGGKIGTLLEIALIGMCEHHGVRFRFVPGIVEVATVRVVSSDLAGLPLIELRPTVLEGWMVFGKRLVDVILAGIALIILSPLLILVAALIKLESSGTVFFKHERVGVDGKEFEVFKFRSMAMMFKDGQLVHSSENQEVERLKEQNSNYKLEHDPRITRVGHFIRKTSIDELPQLWNVLRGEMSLVGPRPYLSKELQKQTESYPQTKALVQRLLTVRPGLTGLWQVSGRSNIEFTERVSMDAYYATNANIWLDLKIMFQTVPVVLKGSGAM